MCGVLVEFLIVEPLCCWSEPRACPWITQKGYGGSSSHRAGLGLPRPRMWAKCTGEI